MAQLTNTQTGETQQVSSSGGEITATGASDLRLDIPQAEVLGAQQVGDDLVVNLTNGNQITDCKENSPLKYDLTEK